MPFAYPDLIRKDTDLESLDETMLNYWNEKMHVFWSQIESGTVIPVDSWNLKEVYIYHKKIVEIMKAKNFKHISPINSLDVVREN